MDIFHNFANGRNRVLHCSCNRNYSPADQADAVEHARYHAEFERVTRNKGHVPYGFNVREQLKDAGRSLLDRATRADDIGVAADMILRAYFDRSLERAIDQGVGDLHPSLAEYGRRIAEDGQLDPRVNAALLVTYRDAPRASGTIEDTLWEPPPYVRAWAALTETN